MFSLIFIGNGSPERFQEEVQMEVQVDQFRIGTSARYPPKNLELFQNIKEILEDFPSENFTLEFVERNARHIFKHPELSWLGLPQGRVFFA